MADADPNAGMNVPAPDAVLLTAPKGVVGCTAPNASGAHVEHRVRKDGTVSVHPAAVERLEALGFTRAA